MRLSLALGCMYKPVESLLKLFNAAGLSVTDNILRTSVSSVLSLCLTLLR